jgi:thiol-disulfide isomerase/thioredoxin
VSSHNSIILIAAICIARCAAQTPQPSVCVMSPAVREALNAAPNAWDYRISFQERMKPLRSVVEKHPSDVAAQRRFQDAFRTATHLYAEFDAAFATYRTKPRDPLYRYLEARLTASFDRTKAEEMYSRLLQEQRGFAWAHLGIAELTDHSGARDAKKAEPHLRAFVAACPQSVDGYALLRTVEDPEMIRDGAAKLRPLLEAQVDTVSLPYWRYLWDLEFRATPKDQQEAVRQRVLRDAELLKKIPRAPSRDWYYAFDYAVTLTRSETLRDWLESTVLKDFPDAIIAVNVERAQWARQHPRPARDAKPEEIKAWSDLNSAWQEETARRHPDDYNVIYDQWLALSGNTSRPLAERLAIADAFSIMKRRSPDVGWSSTPLDVELANLYTKWNVRSDQVVGLVQSGMKAAELEQKYAPVPSMYPAQITQPNPLALAYNRAYSVMTDHHIAAREADRARDVIGIGLASLDRRPVFPPDSAQGKSDAEFRRREWLPRKARLALLEGDTEAALSLFREYLNAQETRALKDPTLVYSDSRDAIVDAKRLYLVNGGVEASWLEWAKSTSSDEVVTLPSREFSNAMPDFEAVDLYGRRWRLSDLKGKATYVDVWATWCGSCRAEHPEWQRLYEAVKDRKDIQVLTFSVDETAYVAESYMKQQKYTFPVIGSKDLAEKLFPMAGYPQGWIIDARGRRSSPARFWSVEQAIRELEAAAGSR